MSLLQPIVDSARMERLPQRVLLLGVEGVGRSRQLAASSNLYVEVSRSPLLGQTLRALLGEKGGDDAVLAALSAAPALQGVDADRARVSVELLASLVGIQRPDFRTARLDDESRREGATLELARWVLERAQAGVFVIAFDDAHLADDEGIAFLEALSQREEPVPLVLVVSADADPERHSAAFKVRREAWTQDKRWRRIELRVPTGVELIGELEKLGATNPQALTLVRHTNGNPGLSMGLWPQLRDGAVLEHLPTSLDGLRLLRVKALGADVARACATLGGLGGVAPLAALSSISPTLLTALAPASQAGLIEVRREGPFELARLADPRLRVALNQMLSQGELLGARLSAGAWAVQALEAIAPADFNRVASFLVPLATPVLDGATASLWDEAWSFSLGGRAETIARLESAVRAATGVRRLVLLRRIAELKLFLGSPDEAIATVNLALKSAQAPPTPLPELAVGRVLALQLTQVLNRWDRLSTEEAQVALELVRAECVADLVKKEDTQKAFADLEKRLLKLRGDATAHLWIRWAKAWSWFACEVLGRAPDAMRACTLVRKQVAADALAADDDAIAFVRAEEIATSALGQLTRAREITEEHIALAERAGRLRDACLGWNARAIVHYGQGELRLARKAFERSLELARSTGWLRREAITLHNLTLVLVELNELELAFGFETTYGRLSVLIGNHAGKAEAPLVLASVELARGRLKEADALIQQARKVSEANGWEMLVATSRALIGRLRLLRYKSDGDVLEVTKAKNDLLAAIEVFEERNLAWSEELDPGEVFAQYAVALKWSGQAAAAKKMLTDAVARFPAENAVSHHEFEVAQAFVSGQSLDGPLKWFEDNGFHRRAALWRKF
jgi:tetratricopeptide (TPR) repeat protein